MIVLQLFAQMLKILFSFPLANQQDVSKPPSIHSFVQL